MAIDIGPHGQGVLLLELHTRLGDTRSLLPLRVSSLEPELAVEQDSPVGGWQGMRSALGTAELHVLKQRLESVLVEVGSEVRLSEDSSTERWLGCCRACSSRSLRQAALPAMGPLGPGSSRGKALPPQLRVSRPLPQWQCLCPRSTWMAPLHCSSWAATRPLPPLLLSREGQGR